MVDIWAITKTWRGEEFALASLNSIYDHVRGVIYVHSEISWDGRSGNTVEEIVRTHPDPDQKIVHLQATAPAQNEQYNQAVDYLTDKCIAYDYAMLIDTDEVMSEEGWAAALPELDANNKRSKPFPAIKCRLQTYLKSPFYRVDPPVPLSPVVFVHSGSIARGALDIRGVPLSNTNAVLQNVWIHHFCSVRASLTDVWSKHSSSCFVESEPIVDREEWVKNVWNRLPDAHHCSPLAKCPHDWMSIRRVTMDDLPAAVRDMDITRAWATYPPAIMSIKTTINKLTMEEVGLPSGFGPAHPDWKMPSRRNLYKMWQAGCAPAKGRALPKPIGPVATEPALDSGTLSTSPPPPPIVSMAKLSPAQRNRLYLKTATSGKTAIMTVVSGAYQWYIPMFIECLRSSYPEYDVLVYVRGEVMIPAPWADLVIPLDCDDYPMDGYTTAALRFVYCDDRMRGYDYMLITDCDMLIRRETPLLVDQHARALRVHDLDCYHNYISMMVGDRPRVPGVHFVTRDWWNKTEAARKKYADDLRICGSHGWEWDEIMLGWIITDSGLPYPSTDQHLWTHHGIHLGDWRLRLQRGEKTIGTKNAFEQEQIISLRSNAAWLDVCNMCAPHLSKLKETVELWKKI